MKKTIFFLTILLILSSCIFVNAQEQTIDIFGPTPLEGAAGNRAIDEGEDIAVSIEIGDGLEFVSFMSVEQPSYGDTPVAFTWSVYNWKTDEATSKKAENLLFTKRITGYVQYENLSFTFDNPLPSGKYLVVLSNPEREGAGGNVGVFCHEGKEGIGVYFSGQFQENTAIRAKIVVQEARVETPKTGDSLLLIPLLILLSASFIIRKKLPLL